MLDNETAQRIAATLDVTRRLEKVEKDIEVIKPIVYNTSNSVKQIEKSVEKMEVNSDKIKGYFLASLITATVGGVVGVVFLTLKLSIGG